MRLWLFMILCNGPLAWVVLTDTWESATNERKAARARKKGVCQRKVAWVPGKVCGQPIAARIDVYEGYEYRFLQWLCDEHARDVERRDSARRIVVDREAATV